MALKRSRSVAPLPGSGEPQAARFCPCAMADHLQPSIGGMPLVLLHVAIAARCFASASRSAFTRMSARMSMASGVCTNTLALPIAETDDTVLDMVEGEALGG